MAGTSSTLAQHVAAASRGDFASFVAILKLYGSSPLEEAPSELKLLDAHAITDQLVARIAATASFDARNGYVAALRQICSINGPKSNVEVVIAGGAIEQVVQHCLCSPAASLQEAACSLLISIIHLQGLDAQIVQAIISAGSIPRLCQLLSKGKTSSIKASAAQLLWMIEHTAPGSTLPDLVAVKAARHLTPLLASLDPGVLTPAAVLLHQLLTAYPTKTLPLAAKAGAVRHLVVLLGSADILSRKAVYCCVAAMAQDEQCSRALAAAGAVPKLVAAVGDASTPPALLTIAAAALNAMTHISLLLLLRQQGAVQALVSALQRYQCTAGAAAPALSEAAAAPSAATAAAAGPSSTSGPMQPEDDAGSAAISCLSALTSIACAPGASQHQSAAGLQAVASAGGLQQMVRLMGAADEAVALVAVSNTSSLLEEAPGSIKPLVQAGAIEALAALLRGSQESPLPAAAAVALASSISVSPEHLKQQAGQAVCSTAGWDTLLAGMLSGRLCYPAVPGYGTSAEQGRTLQGAAVQLLVAAANCSEQARVLVVQAACEELPALVQLLPSAPSATAWLLATVLPDRPQCKAAALQAGAVPALLQLLQTCPRRDVQVNVARVLRELAGTRSGAGALVALGGLQVLPAGLQRHLQQGQAAGAAGAAGRAGAAAVSPQVVAWHDDAFGSVLDVLYLTALHEAQTASVQAALQPLAPQLAQLLAQLQAGQRAGAPARLSGFLAMVLALLQPADEVLQAAGPDVAGSVASGAPVLQEHRMQLASALLEQAAAGTAPMAAAAGAAVVESAETLAVEPLEAAAAAAEGAGGGAAAAAAAVDTCARCSAKSGQDGARLQACGRCRAVSYCSKACQRAHWPQHKGSCAPV